MQRLCKLYIFIAAQPAPQPAYSIAMRYPQAKPLDTPGPGAYDPKVPLKTSPRAILNTSKDSFFRQSEVPGPGMYKDYEHRSTGITFSREKRSRTNDHVSPGPAAYSIKFILKSSPRCIIPKGKQQIQEQSIIGPGCYQLPAMFPETKGFSMPMGRRKLSLNQYPGPADYSHIETTLRNGIKFGKNPKLKLDLKDVPGPGQYSPKLQTENSPRPVIGSSQRAQRSVMQIPGPGDYNIPKSTGIRVKYMPNQYSFPKYREQFRADSTPFTYIKDYTSFRRKQEFNQTTRIDLQVSSKCDNLPNKFFKNI